MTSANPHQVDDIRRLLSRAKLLCEQVKVDYAASATLVATGDLAMRADEIERKYLLTQMGKYEFFVMLLTGIEKELD